MKKYLLALALLLTLNASGAGVQPRHRHHAQTEVVDSTKKDSLEAYSDTTDTQLDEDEDTTFAANNQSIDLDDDWGGMNWLKGLLGGAVGVGGVFIAVMICVAVLIFLAAPFIVLILLIRYLINRNNNRVRLAEKAMETGQPIPEDMKAETSEDPNFYKKRGIKNIALGIGLAIMFFIWDATPLAGVGLLIACLGVGQLVIAKTSK